MPPPRAHAHVGEWVVGWAGVLVQIESLLTVMQSVALPDIDVCVTEELPQVPFWEGFQRMGGEEGGMRWGRGGRDKRVWVLRGQATFLL